MHAEVDTLNDCVHLDGLSHGRTGGRPGEFRYPSSVAVLNQRAYVADSWNHRIQVFDLPDWKFAFQFEDFFCPKWIGVVENSGLPLLAIIDTNNARICFHQPDGRRIAVCDSAYRRFPVAARHGGPDILEIVFEDGYVETLCVSDAIQPPWSARGLDKPISLARDRNGCFYVSDVGRRVVEKFDAEGNFLAQILGPALLKESGRLIMNGDDLIVTDRPANTVITCDTVTGKHGTWEFPFNQPGFLGRDLAGRIWVGTYVDQPSAAGARFAVFSDRYQFIRNVVFAESCQPTFISFNSERILIADQAARNVLTFSYDGVFEGVIREQAYEQAVWTIANDGAANVYVGTGTVADMLWAPDLDRLYYIDLENSAVRYIEACSLPSKPKA